MNGDGFFKILDSVLAGIMFVLGLLAVIVAIVIAVRMPTHYFDVRDCRQFAETSNRETKFVHYTWMTWDCLTPAEDGRWIPVDQLREFGS